MSFGFDVGLFSKRAIRAPVYISAIIPLRFPDDCGILVDVASIGRAVVSKGGEVLKFSSSALP